MAPDTSIYFAAYFMMVQCIVINIAVDEFSIQHDNTTNYASEWNSGEMQQISIHQKYRSERSPGDRLPILLKIQVKYPTGTIIHMKFLKKTHYLANRNLPVRSSRNHLDPDAMAILSDFILYLEIEKCSSLEYFAHSNKFFGSIGENYIIDNLPNMFDEHGNYAGVVEAPFLKHRTQIFKPDESTVAPMPLPNILDDCNSPLQYQSGKRSRYPSDSEPEPKHRRVERDSDVENYQGLVNRNVSAEGTIRERRQAKANPKYYLETLVFITDDITAIFSKSQSGLHYTQLVVEYCINYFNAVDTMFQIVPPESEKFYINLAQIVLIPNIEVLHSINNGEIEFSGTVRKLRQYLSNHQQRYTPDSFDYVFLITNHQILHESVPVRGMTDYRANLYEERDEGRFYEAVPITVAGFTYSHYAAVSEIAKTMGIPLGGKMLQVGSECNHCLKWFDESIEQFDKFLRENHNRCFLLNEPRSLRPPGPSKFLTPSAQCRCFGYQTAVMSSGHRVRTIRKNACNEPLYCRKRVEGTSTYAYILPPFDGTSCGCGKMVCWNRKCVHLNPS